MPDLIQQNISLSQYSNFKIGGPARYFLEFHNLEELKSGLAEWEEIKTAEFDRIFIISGATNILFDDAGFDGLILRNAISYIQEKSYNLIEVGAGTSVRELNEFCLKNSLSGMEWSGGLPGSFGGAIFGNAGAFGGETKDSIIEVESYDYISSQILRRNNLECQFDYRNSIFKSAKLPEIIISAQVQLKPRNKTEIATALNDHIDYRQRKQPLEYPNIGSIFKNVDIKFASPELIERVQEKIKNDPFPVIPTAYLIFLSGLVGRRIGGAQISDKHPNMIINANGAAMAVEVRELMRLIQSTVADKFGVKLEPEVRQLQRDGLLS